MPLTRPTSPPGRESSRGRSAVARRGKCCRCIFGGKTQGKKNTRKSIKPNSMNDSFVFARNPLSSSCTYFSLVTFKNFRSTRPRASSASLPTAQRYLRTPRRRPSRAGARWRWRRRTERKKEKKERVCLRRRCRRRRRSPPLLPLLLPPLLLPHQSTSASASAPRTTPTPPSTSFKMPTTHSCSGTRFARSAAGAGARRAGARASAAAAAALPPPPLPPPPLPPLPPP